MSRFLLFCLMIILTLFSKAQNNPCGVVARFTPGDSILSGPGYITFTSTSINATSYKWYVNKIALYSTTNTATVYVNSAGTALVTLVASNGSCSDTAYATVFYAGTPHPNDSVQFTSYGLPLNQESGYAIDDMPDGGFIMGGVMEMFNQFGSSYNTPYIVKAKKSGCMEWSARLGDGYGGTLTSVFGCADSSVLVAMVDATQGAYVARLDKDGHELWRKRFGTDLIRQFIQDADGNIYAVAVGRYMELNGLMVLKMNLNGNLIWDRYFATSHEYSSAMDASTLVLLRGHIFLAGYTAVYSDAISDFIRKNFLLKLDAATGATNWMKSYIFQGGKGGFSQVTRYDTLLLVTGTSQLSGDPRIGQSLAFIDQEGNFKNGLLITHQNNNASGSFGYFNGLTTYVECDADKNIYSIQGISQPTSLQPGYINYYYTYKMDSSAHLSWLIQDAYSGRGTITSGALNKYGEWGAFGRDLNNQDGMFQSQDFQLMKVIKAPVNSTCFYYSNNFIFHTIQYTTQDYPLLSDSVLNPPITTPPVPMRIINSLSRFECPAYVDSCSAFNLTGPSAVCRLSGVYTYKTMRNKNCGLPVHWTTEGPLTIIAQSDSAITVQMPRAGQYKIVAELVGSCTTRRDSVMVLMKPAPVVDLGLDTSVCAGSTVALHAGKRYLTYSWQDGSTDSLFTVNTPGQYWVSVTDSCGNPSSDTINVNAISAIPIDIGPDRGKCNNDTIHLSAPPGFISYSWSNDYNISSLTAQNVVVAPSIDTAYYLRAEKTPGCFGFDTVRIAVHHSPPIDLGPDISFCSGDSARFDAGAGLSSYSWSNGAATQQVTVRSTGSYSVIGATAEGCKSYDTVRVINVFPLPVVALDHDPALCIGSTRVLDAGNFASYSWNTGSVASSITISSTGTYAVQVTDHHGCKDSDTATITILLPLPSGFLPADTAICSYGTLQLKAGSSYMRYLWSSGAVTPSLEIAQPGIYWLQVTGDNQCTGRDSITVVEKQCLEGLYVPDAFTPNGDGKNDVFTPRLFGQVKSYSFTIYNRWGRVVFLSKRVGSGWDGSFGSSSQDGNVFVWLCTYQLEGGPVVTKRGTLVLIR